MSDNTTVSWDYYELKQFASTLGVPVWKVVKAKEESGLNDRAALKDLIMNQSRGESSGTKTSIEQI